MNIKFTEVLNELVSCFLLGDIAVLQRYKAEEGLPDDLATEFTTQKTGDEVVIKGVVIPLMDIENYPYTVIFRLSDDTPELLQEGNDLQVRQGGYILEVASGEVMLFGWRVLEHFTDETIDKLNQYQHQYNRPKINLENGWYSVKILAGQTRQGECLEPTLEFVFTKIPSATPCTADIFTSYRIHSDEY